VGERRVGDAVVEVLRAASVDTVFGIPGLHTLGLYDALAGAPSIRHVLTRHEQGAAFAADGYARTAREPGVCSTITGPGAFNTLAAVAEAWSDSSPVVVLAGQIDAGLEGQGRGVLHETPDQGRSFEAVTAYVGRPRTPEAVPAAVAEAVRTSMAGRPQPTYVELPTDLLTQPFRGELPAFDWPLPQQPDPDQIAAAAGVLSSAERVVIVAGAGVLRAGATEDLRAFARSLDAVVTAPASAAGAIPADDHRWGGLMLAARPESRALFEEADVVVVVGCRLDDIQTGRLSLPLPNLVHIDVDPVAIGRTYPAQVGVVADAGLALRALVDELGGQRTRPVADWGTARATIAREAAQQAISPGDSAMRAAFFETREVLGREAILTHDAALINAWSGYAWPVYEPEGSVFPWGSASLGFALPAANGAAVAASGRRVVATCGDGGFLFTATELATSVAHQLDVTVLIHDDSAFGSIANYQMQHHGRTYATDLHNPDLVAFARSFGVPAERIESMLDLPATMARVTSQPGPSVVVLSAPLRNPWV
jgi:thiamine pyrophosphate-dependent acetolactate synthase large subunit-like protein